MPILSILRRRETKPFNRVTTTPSDHQLNTVLDLQQQKIRVKFRKLLQQRETMAHQFSRRTTREVRQLFGQLYDRAAGLAETFQPCGCDGGANAEDAQALNTMVQNLLAVRQRAGGCICGPPCDGTLVDNLSDEALQSMLAKLQWDASVLDEHLEPCGCVAETELVRIPRTLMTLPPEIRNMIWWRSVSRQTGYVLIRARRFYISVPNYDRSTGGSSSAVDNSHDFWFKRARFSVEGERIRMRWTFHRDGEYWVDDDDARVREAPWALPPLLRVSRQVFTEVEDEFWRRISSDDLVLAFSHRGIPGIEYFGIFAAWTFFNTYRDRSFQGIRQVHLGLTGYNEDRARGAGGEAFPEPINRRYARDSGREHLEPLLDLMGTELPNLQFLSLRIGGRVPDEPSGLVSDRIRLCLSLLVLTAVLRRAQALRWLVRLPRTLCTGLRGCAASPG